MDDDEFGDSSAHASGRQPSPPSSSERDMADTAIAGAQLANTSSNMDDNTLNAQDNSEITGEQN